MMSALDQTVKIEIVSNGEQTSGHNIATNVSLTSSQGYLPTIESLNTLEQLKVVDPSTRICKYEVPGGGLCHDSECKDLHLLSSMGLSISGDVSELSGESTTFLSEDLLNIYSLLSRTILIALI